MFSDKESIVERLGVHIWHTETNQQITKFDPAGMLAVSLGWPVPIRTQSNEFLQIG